MVHRRPWIVLLTKFIEKIVEFIKIKYLITTKINKMKRFNLLTATQENKNENTFKRNVANELRVLNKEVSDLQFNIEGEEGKLEVRMSNPAEVTKTEILTMYAKVKELREQKELIEAFITEYYAD
jgi:hypothetical protein